MGKNRPKQRKYSERRLERRLVNLFERLYGEKGGGACTFGDRMLMTDSKGVVLMLPSGQEFLLTLAESTRL